MEDPTQSRDDRKRERDVFNLYAVFKDTPHIDLGPSSETSALPSDYIPKSASDASLAAFAQLAAFRLNAQRSVISLLDGKYQYILAEATTRTSLRVDSPLNNNSDLFIGQARVLRSWGICDRVLDPVALKEEKPGIIIIKDLTQCEQYANRSYIKEGPKFRFYAGVPIKSANDTIVGSLCILDGPRRTDVSSDEVIYLQDLASTVMEHLVTYTVRAQYRRGAEGLNGLISFAEGDLSQQPSKEPGHSRQLSLRTGIVSTDSGAVRSNEEPGQDASIQTEMTRSGAPTRPSKRGSPGRRDSVSDLQNMVLPNTARKLFARAADIIRKSRDMDGIMFLDASVATTGFTSGDASPTRRGAKPCQVLSFATQDRSSSRNELLPADMTPLESDFTLLLKQYPEGYCLDCAELQPVPATCDTTPATESGTSKQPKPEDRTHRESPMDHTQLMMRLEELLPGIKSALFLPLWDFERARWFAGCFCWSTRVERSLSGPLELPFLKVFSHSIMQEISRLDANNTNQTKTTFMSSLSHELRSPLHGILGSVQLMRSTLLDSFQSSMVNSIAICGRTLLETVQHLLDHAERRELSSGYSTKTNFPEENTICITSESAVAPMTTGSSPSEPFCNVGLVTEEVVEAIFLGQGRFDISIGGDDPGAPLGLSQKTGNAISQRRSRFIIVDIADHANLDFKIPASSYGRLIMNLLGNALKFTETGYVQISLRLSSVEEGQAPMEVRITDTGIGMCKDFLFKGAFEPFRKCNEHSAGTGVGLSVVRRIIEDIGGTIKIKSQPNVGTDITLQLPLARYDRPHEPESPHSAIYGTLAQLKGRKVCVLYSKSPDASGPPDHLRHWEVLKRYIHALTTTVRNELNMEVTESSEWTGHEDADVVVFPEISFASLKTIREKAAERPPALLFITMDMVEADTLRCDARVTSQSSVVEIMTQPCGPFKLGMVLSQCLKRLDGSNLASNNLNTPYRHGTTENGSQQSGSDLIADLGPRLGLYPPLVVRTKDASDNDANQPMSALGIPQETEKEIEKPQPSSSWTDAQRVLVVDDNAINRRLLSVFMKKRKLAYAEAKDGKEALEMYRDASEQFDIILMDISMPIMDGMTSTRLIREHENKHNLKPAHIIVLTGLASASAKLEAWTSGVDDFLTKPVDFNKLEDLMKVGRGGQGTGFLKDREDGAPEQGP
ncbi:hypothetical protein BDW02DRAFT_551737 [Decorospora gaudefroyi]|uniref:Sensor histidine kinase-like protein/response regulator n=1 Tax=Decorospora gaudefroyi TaxID=184978 RepID=A0A6A5KCG1_9PLEO|nr:hypothetical protein BDW02DRAFT_551737 [Decorospora gaudefroyi]